ncbi:MAG: hypothetical protein KJ726_06405, partial [Verrucomicrobia bacterium]|nr:hypothetical protein [Verrucomicrobiota bacterium]
PPARKPAPGEDPYGIMIERYLSNKRMIESACEAFDIPVLFVWQPIPYYKYNLRHHPFARKNRNSPRARRYTMRYTRMADWVRAQPMGTNFLWCADIQEGVQEALYVDDVHYSPRLNRLLAKAIASGIVERAHSAP